MNIIPNTCPIRRRIISTKHLKSAFTGTSLILEDNKISATNATRVGIDNLPTNTTVIILLGNVLTKATINKRVTDVSLNKIVDDVVSS